MAWAAERFWAPAMLAAMKTNLAFVLALVGLAACNEARGSTIGTAGHVHGPHDGLVAPFQGGSMSGHLELKLHDDKGDLELWLGHDKSLSTPFDLPLETVVEVEFTDRDGRKVALRPRNRSRNEDESGTPNIRDGQTNYFIFPSQAGEDPSWLQGKEFKSLVIVRFTRDGSEFVSLKMKLAPHTH